MNIYYTVPQTLPKFRMLYIQHHLCAYRNQVSKFRFCNRYLPHFPLIVVSII